ncbi:MAG: hypothetical protein ACKVQS_02645 [Fimbriimonadaceae bacterium]
MFEATVRKWMEEFPDPREWCAHRGRFVGIFSLDQYQYDDPVIDRWIKDVAMALKCHDAICACEEEYLSGDELEKRRWFAANERRREERDRLRAERHI